MNTRLDSLVGYYELLCIMFAEASEDKKDGIRQEIKKLHEEIQNFIKE